MINEDFLSRVLGEAAVKKLRDTPSTTSFEGESEKENPLSEENTPSKEKSSKRENNNIITPDYYKGENGFECIDIIEGLGLGDEFALGNAIKYLTRAGKKYGETIDTAINKAVYYLERFLKKHDEYKKNIQYTFDCFDTIRIVIDEMKETLTFDDDDFRLRVIENILELLILGIQHFRKEQKTKQERIPKNEWLKKVQEYRESKEWAELSQKRFLKDGLRCVKCGSTKNLVAHHLNYYRMFHEDINDLITLCGECHKKLHEAKQ